MSGQVIPVAVPCHNATLWEVNRNKHLTTSKSGICSNCDVVLRTFEARKEYAEGLDYELE